MTKVATVYFRELKRDGPAILNNYFFFYNLRTTFIKMTLFTDPFQILNNDLNTFKT